MSNLALQQSSQSKRKEIYRYEAPWTAYAMNWSQRPDKKFRLAISSFIEEYSNRVQIVQLDEEAGEFTVEASFDHPYPATKVMWFPDVNGQYPDLLATSADYLRLFRISDDNSSMECLLNNAGYSTSQKIIDDRSPKKPSADRKKSIIGRCL
uniref:Uncharacterized protein n=1 Tax=Romanomermis culicivorax TaxID=13658 RepID=A0A915HXZ6_ROMCU